jgi:hypothetical protein
MADLAAITRIDITARDQTQAAFSSVNRGLSEMRSSFGAIQATIASLTGIAGLGFMASWAKDVVSAAAALDDLADATGSSVENLSKLANIARVSGTSFDTIDAAIKKLAVGMAGVDEESSRAGKALAAIGIQSRDPAQAMLDIAKSFAGYADGAEKAALAVAIFGKAGASLLPVLKDIAENTDIAGTITAKQAQDAENLEKSWRRLGFAGTELRNSLLNDIVPALSEVITSFNLARAAGLGFWESIKMTGNYGPGGVAQAIAETTAELQKFRDLEAKSAGGWAEEYAKKVDVLEKKLKALKDLQYSLDAPNRGALKAIGDLMGPGLPSAPKVGGGDANAKAAIDFWVKGMGDIAEALKAEDAARKKSLESAQAQLDLIDKLYEANAKNVEQIDKTTEGYQKQLDALTMTEDAILAKEQARLQEIVNSRIYENYINAETDALQRQIEVIEQLRGAKAGQESAKAAQEAAREWQKAADSIQNSLTDALMRGFESGKDWAKNFVDTLKNLFGSLVLRPVIQAIAAPAAGGITSMFSSGASGGGSSLSSASSLLGLGSFGSGASISMGNIGSLGLFEGSMANFANIGGQLTAGSILPALGMAMPYVAAAVAIGTLVKGFLDSKKGGPKSGGYGLAGSISSVNRNDLFTPNNADSSAAAIAQTTLAAFKQTIAALGGSGSAGFDIGYNSDPQGSAPNQLGVRSFVNGQQVYGYSAGDSLGRDDATLEAAINLESKRALLAALQASDLPEQIAAVFDSVNASGASASTIDNLLAFGSAMKVVIDAISGSVVDDAQTAWENSQRSSIQVLRDMGNEVIRLANNMDGTVGSMQDLATATTNYRQAVTQTLLALKQMKVDIDALFSGTRQSLTTYGMSPLDTYNYYRTDADAAYAELQTTTDPARARTLANVINNDIMAAFNALPDADKLTMRGPLLTFLNDVNALVTGFGAPNGGTSVIDRIWDIVVNGTVDPFAAANSSLNGAADKFGTAATDSVTAATNMNTAVRNFSAAVGQFAQAVGTPLTAIVPPPSNVNA